MRHWISEDVLRDATRPMGARAVHDDDEEAARRVAFIALAVGVASAIVALILKLLSVPFMPEVSHLALAAGVGVALLLALRARQPWAPALASMSWAFSVPLLMVEPYVSTLTSPALFIGAGMSLLMSGRLLLVFNSVVPLVVLVMRAEGPSPYLQPTFLIVATLVFLSFLLTQTYVHRALSRGALQTRRLRAITSGTNDVIVVRPDGPDGTLPNAMFVSESVRRVLGYEPEVYGKLQMAELVHVDDRDSFAGTLRTLRARPGGTMAIELRALHASGEHVWVESRITNLLHHPDVAGFVTTFNDVSSRHRDRAAFQEAIEHVSMHDPLTGLPNRSLMLRDLATAMEGARKTETPLTVLLCDIDHFKVVNDSLGHDAGDDVLRSIAEALAACLPPSAQMCRFGGDEFVVIYKGATAAIASGLGDQLLDAIRDQTSPRGGGELHITMSLGIAELEDSHSRPEHLIRDADVAMYNAKESGRNRIAGFDAAMRARAFRRHELEQALWQALKRDEFELHFQPKVSLKDGRVTGFEALVRWNHREHGMIGPADFIPLAEESGAIVPLGAWVLEQACRQIKRWREKFPTLKLEIAVNLSGRQLHSPRILHDVEQALALTGLAPSELELEITESVVMTNASAAIERLQQLKELGVKLAIDDFGTGYSSLSYLRRLPVDILKIDRAFVSGLGQDPEDAEIVRLVITMAQALGLSTVAEGVENDTHLNELRALGCDVAQGYLIAKPMPVKDAEAFLERSQHQGIIPETLATGDAPNKRQLS